MVVRVRVAGVVEVAVKRTGRRREVGWWVGWIFGVVYEAELCWMCFYVWAMWLAEWGRKGNGAID